MNIKSLIFAVLETIIKVVVLGAAIMVILRGVHIAYDFGYRVFKDEPVSANNGRTITVGIPDNASVADIAAMLEEKGLITDARLFRVQELLSSYHDKIKPGIYDLSTGMTANEMLQVMSLGEAAEDGEEETPAQAVEEEPEYFDELQEDLDYAVEEGTEDAPAGLVEEDTGG